MSTTYSQILGIKRHYVHNLFSNFLITYVCAYAYTFFNKFMNVHLLMYILTFITCIFLFCQCTPLSWIFFFFGYTLSMWKFPKQGLNPCHSSNLSCCSDNNGFFNPLCHKRTLWVGFIQSQRSIGSNVFKYKKWSKTLFYFERSCIYNIIWIL